MFQFIDRSWSIETGGARLQPREQFIKSSQQATKEAVIVLKSLYFTAALVTAGRDKKDLDVM